MKKIVESYSPEDTSALAEKLVLNAKPGTVFALSGDLGVGKTIFAKGMARGLGISEPVVSPTFTILQEYHSGRIPFYHFDVYRIEEPEEMEETGFDDAIYGDGVSLIEWAEMIEDIMPEHYTKILIEKNPENGFDYRKITIMEI